jgi:hypothetical protein
LILKLRNKNLTYKEIAEELKRLGLKNPTGKTMEANHVFSICKKRIRRDLRLTTPPVVVVENLSIRYIVE